MTINITNGDCLKLMKDLPDKSVDLFICDLPYGETNCKWDSVIDLDEFWKEFKRLRKSKRTACIHFCSTKFGYTLIKSNEKMFKMDMVWKKRNKTGGLQSRNRPMRNHEMVYFFYEQAPQYNRDTYHKRIQAKPAIEKNKTIKSKDRKSMGESSGIYTKENQTGSSFDPPNPASVVEEADIYGETKEQRKKRREKGDSNFDPPNPASVLEGGDIYGEDKKDQKNRRKEMYKKSGNVNSFDPPNPASVVEEKPKKKLRDKTNSTRAKEGKDIFGNNDTNVKPFNYDPPNPSSVLEEENAESNKVWGYDKPDTFKLNKNGTNQTFKPPNPVSVLEDEHDVWGQSKFSCGGDCGLLNEDGSYKGKYEPPNPASVYESTKVFIGKRHHQTEKPQDILEFFIKYWSDEGHTILDPTMGSGSTGVACKNLKRNFIGFEKDEKIFNVAKNRINKPPPNKILKNKKLKKVI